MDRTLAGLDILDYFFPYRVYARQAVEHGRLPLWNPDIFGGAPFLANIQSSLLYPPTALFYVLSEPAAYNWSLLLHVFLGGLFTYLFARQSLRVGRAGALLSAVIFALGGFLGGQLDHLNQLSAAIWLPALLLCWDKAVSGRRLTYIPLGALVIALQFLAGHTQESYFMLVTLLLYAVFTTLLSARRRGLSAIPMNLIVAGALLAIGTGLSAAQLVPTAEMNSWGIRGNGLTYAEAANGSLKGTLLLNAILPPFWNRDLVTVPGNSEFLGYVSVAGLVLAAAALLYARQRHTLFFSLLAVAALVLALGPQEPAYPFLFRYLPGLNLFRVPARWLLVSSFSLAVLAGLGLNALLAAGPKRNWRPLSLLLVLAAALAAAGAHTQVLPPRSTIVTWTLFGLASLVLVFSAIRVFGPPPSGWRERLGEYERRQRRASAGFGAAAIGLVLVELWLGGQSLDYNHPTPSQVFTTPVDTPSFLQKQDQPFRILSVARDEYAPGIEAQVRQQFGHELSEADILDYLRDYKLRQILEPNTPMAEGLATLDGYDGGLLPLSRYVIFKDLLTGVPSAPDDRIRFVLKWLPNQALLSLANVRYVIMDAIGDKAANGVRYDLSSFVHLAPHVSKVSLQLNNPVRATSIGIVSAARGVVPLAADEPVGGVTLSDGQGNSRSVAISAAGPDFGTLPDPSLPPTHLTIARLDAPIDVRSLTVTVTANADLYVNGLALIDDGAGTAYSPLMVDGPEWPRVYSGDVKIYQNPAAMGPAFMVHDGRIVRSPEEAAGIMGSGDFDPASTATVEVNPQPPPSTSLLGRIVSKLRRLLPSQPFAVPASWSESTPPASADRVTVDAFAPEDMAFTTQSDADGFLLLSQSYYPGWQVTVDGQPQHPLAADVLFQAVRVPAGRHRVEFRFKPGSMQLGMALSLASVFACLAALLVTALLDRRKA